MSITFHRTGTSGGIQMHNRFNSGNISIYKNVPPVVVGGSLQFAGTATSNLTITNNSSLRMETGDFTVEWWQYQTDSSPFPRVFQMGSFPSANIGVSIEGGAFYFWANGSAIFGRSVTPYKNAWVHFAVTRQGTNLRLFKNGDQVGTVVFNNTNFNNTTNLLCIANEATASNGAAFGGYITNFHLVKGLAKYTSTFNMPTSPFDVLPNTTLLLKAITTDTATIDASGLNTITNNNVAWSSLTPFTG
jgi:hypothetical protein